MSTPSPSVFLLLVFIFIILRVFFYDLKFVARIVGNCWKIWNLLKAVIRHVAIAYTKYSVLCGGNGQKHVIVFRQVNPTTDNRCATCVIAMKGGCPSDKLLTFATFYLRMLAICSSIEEITTRHQLCAHKIILPTWMCNTVALHFTPLTFIYLLIWNNSTQLFKFFSTN